MNAHTLAAACLSIALSPTVRAQAPQLLLDVRPGAAGSGPAFVGDGGGLLARSPRQREILMALDDGVSGRELWRTNGTAVGTSLLVDFVPGAGSTEFVGATSDPEFAWLSIVRSGVKELWRTDGTAAGTILVFDGSLLGAFAYVYPPDPRLVNGARLFRVGNTLWRSDGTFAGTRSLGVEAGEPLIVESGIALYRSLSGNLVSTDGNTASTLGPLPDVIEVTEDGRVLAMQQTVTGMSPLWTVTWVNGPGAPSATFAAWFIKVVPLPGRFVVTTSQQELYGWDDVGGVQLLQTFSPSPSSTNWASARRVGDRVALSANDGVLGEEIWSTDGTAAGTRVLDIAPGVASSNPLLGFEFDGGLVVWARSASGSEPWICDIGLTTATPLADASPGPASSAPYLPDTEFGGSRRLVLYVDTSIHGTETWITDGTPTGTVLLGDVRPGPTGSYVATAAGYPTHLTCGGQLVWLANDGVRGAEPWSVSLPGSRTRLWDYGPRRFDSGDPVLGTTMSLRASRLAPTDLGVVTIGLPAVAASQIAPGRFLHVDPNTAFSPVVIFPSAGGTWTGGVAVVNNPSLIGLDAIVQPVFLAPTLPLGLDVGDALWLNLGP